MFFYNSGLSGGPRISSRLAVALALNGRWLVEAILPSEGSTTEWLRAAAIRPVFIPREPLRARWNPWHHLKYLFKFPGMVASYRRAIREARPDLVHVDSLLNLPALVAGKLSGVKMLLHVQEVAYGTVRGVLASIAGVLADRIVAVSQAAAEPLRRRAAEQNLAVVSNGVSLPESVSYQPDGWITFVGRLSEDKDPVSFLRAAEQVYAQEPTRRFRIVGLTVPGRRRYEERFLGMLRQSPIPVASVSFLRDRSDVEELLRESSVLVNSSSVPESFGLAVLEAMALGVPVVVPRCGAFPEFVRHGETGLLYAAGNSEEMGDCILRLLHDPSLAEQIGLAARDMVRSRFTEERMAAAMEEQYRLLLGSPTAANRTTENSIRMQG